MDGNSGVLWRGFISLEVNGKRRSKNETSLYCEQIYSVKSALRKLSEDLKTLATEPITLFMAKDTAWANPFPLAKVEFGIEGDCHFSDGPCEVKLDDGKLYMTASSWSTNGYTVAVAVSDSGKLEGPRR